MEGKLIISTPVLTGSELLESEVSAQGSLADPDGQISGAVSEAEEISIEGSVQATGSSSFLGNLTTFSSYTAPYTGSYEATPSATTQTFLTAGKQMTGNFVVKPIPSNYGLITYNGYNLTIT